MSSPFGPRRLDPASPDADIGPAVEAALRDDPEVGRLGRRILRAQWNLRKTCPPEAWQAYLRLEELTNQRFHRELVLASQHGSRPR